MAMLGIKLVYQLDVPCVVIRKLLVPPSSNTWYCRLNLINGLSSSNRKLYQITFIYKPH